MLRRSLIAALAAAALVAGCAPIQTPSALSSDTQRALRLSDVRVATPNAVLDTRGARDRASTLQSDLRTALRREFSDRLAPGGFTMEVDVTRLTLPTSTQTAFGRDVGRLQGSVRLIDAAGVLRATYLIQVEDGTAAETTTGALAQAAVTRREGLYRDLLVAFARQTRADVLGADLPGERLARTVARSL
ncbi:MAG: hypothetical protein ACU0CO_14240 [Shimia sp.]